MLAYSVEIFLVLTTPLQFVNCHGSAKGTWFQEITDRNDAFQDVNSPVATPFGKPFHRCNLNEQCNFVLKDLKTGKYKELSNESDLPQDRSGYLIWKKMPQAFKSCKDAKNRGMSFDGVYDLRWNNRTTYRAFCNMTFNGGGWTVIQRRNDANVDFNRNWTECAVGFGNQYGNHWLGLEALHQLTKEGNITVRFDLRDTNGTEGYAEYGHFKIDEEGLKYRISLSQYRGTIGDGMVKSNGKPFSTMDRNNDASPGNCAGFFKGPWWHPYNCFEVNLNNNFGSKTTAISAPPGGDLMSWLPWKGKYGGIIYSDIKLRAEN